MIVAEKSNFETEVLKATEPVLAYFWATWCPSCKMMAKHIEALANENADRFKTVKVEIDENPELAERYNIQSTPTILLFKPSQPQPYEVQIGFAAKDWVLQSVNNFLNR